MRCRYKAINFLTNIHKIQPRACPLGRSTECLFVDPASDWYSASVPVIIYVISYRVIRAPHCITLGSESFTRKSQCVLHGLTECSLVLVTVGFPITKGQQHESTLAGMQTLNLCVLSFFPRIWKFICIFYHFLPLRHRQVKCALVEDNIISSYLVHHSDVIMGMMASQITSLTMVYSTAFDSGADQRKGQAPRHWHLCGECTGDRWIPAQMASNPENVSIWWRHHDYHVTDDLASQGVFLTTLQYHVISGPEDTCMHSKTIDLGNLWNNADLFSIGTPDTNGTNLCESLIKIPTF